MQINGEKILPVLDFSPYFINRKTILADAQLLHIKTSSFEAMILVDILHGNLQ